jgi:hypothetical protein
VRSEKANASEPLMKGRNAFQTVSKPEHQVGSGMSVGDGLFAADAAPGLEAARSRIRLRHGTLEPVVPMRRESHKRLCREGKSTNAGHRGGTARSSVERPVMGRERRGGVIQFLANRSTACGGRNP